MNFYIDSVCCFVNKMRSEENCDKKVGKTYIVIIRKVHATLLDVFVPLQFTFQPLS